MLLVNTPPALRSINIDSFSTITSEKTGSAFIINTQGEDERWTISSSMLSDGNLLQIGKSSTLEDELLNNLERVFSLLVLPTLLLALSGGMFLTYRATSPLRSLAKTISEILDTGKSDLRVSVHPSKGALNQLSTAFNQLLDHQQHLIDRMREAHDAVAHDLKTPMTRLRSAAEFALRSEKLEDYREALADCMEESGQVIQLLDTMMDVAEAESGILQLHCKATDVSAIIDELLDVFQYVAEEKQLRFENTISAKLCANVDPVRIRQVLSNLIDNAIKYSPSGSTITLSGKATSHELEIGVADQGIGISASEQDRIWERLYRGNRSRTTHGLGLGLNLARAIVEAHGGSIRVESEVNKGSMFVIFLPTKLP